MSLELCSLPQWQVFIIMLVWAVVEAWLPNTKKIAANSVLGLVFQLIKNIVIIVWRKTKEKK